MADLNAIVSTLDALSVVESNQLVKIVEQKWGVSGATNKAPAPVQKAPEPVAETQTEFTVSLTGAGNKKINVIKEVRAITGFALKEAKDLVEAATAGAPKLLTDHPLSRAEVDKIAKMITDAGGTVEIK